MATPPVKAPAEVLIAGAGYSGSALLRALRDQGINAIGGSRNPPTGPQHLALDLDGAIDPLPASIRSIVFLVPPASGQPEPRLQRLLNKLSSPPERIVLASTSGVYGDCNGELVDENRATAPLTERATRRVEQENTLLDYCRTKSVRAVILRIAGIYGPGRLPVAALERKDPVIRISEANPGNRIHRDDLVEALRLALVSEQAEGIYNVADGNFVSGTDYYQRVANALGLELPPEISREQARKQFSKMRYSFLRESRRLDTKRLRKHLGLQLRYANLDEGIAASIYSG